MHFSSKSFINNSFVLYDENDEIICYFDNFNELSRYINYKLYDLVREFNRHKKDLINIEIDRKRYKLATFC